MRGICLLIVLCCICSTFSHAHFKGGTPREIRSMCSHHVAFPAEHDRVRLEIISRDALKLSKNIGVDYEMMIGNHTARGCSQRMKKFVDKTRSDGRIRPVYEQYRLLKEVLLKLSAVQEQNGPHRLRILSEKLRASVLQFLNGVDYGYQPTTTYNVTVPPSKLEHCLQDVADRAKRLSIMLQRRRPCALPSVEAVCSSQGLLRNCGCQIHYLQ